MAEERTLGLARAPEAGRYEPSKEELQRRMEEARESISHTVTEIKETVSHQVDSVRDALDWREHFKKQPVVWSLGAAGVGFFVGYRVAAALKGDGGDSEYLSQADTYAQPSHAYAAQPILGGSAVTNLERSTNGSEEEGPSLLDRFKETSAYDRLSKEVSSLGDRAIDELSKTAQFVVLPLVLSKIKHWIGLDLADKSGEQSTGARAKSSAPSPASGGQPRRSSTYEPVLERPS
jgi:hypothetical protein